MSSELEELEEFKGELMSNGIIGYSRSDLRYLLETAKRCSRLAGVPMAGVGAVGMAGAGAVALPVVGAVPGWVAGMLAGFVGGTASCMVAQGSLKRQLDKILEQR